MTRRTLEILSLVVLALAVAVLADRPRPGPEQLPDRVLPGFVPAAVRRIALRGAGRPETVVERASDGFALAAPVAAAADPDAVRDLLGTLEYLAFRRRVRAGDAARRGLDAPRLTVEITDDAGAVATLRVGAAEPLLGRTWVSRGGADDYLVDDYAVRALERRPDELRLRAPFRGATPARIVVEAAGRRVVLRGACVEIAGGCAAADRARLDGLREQLGDLTVTRFLAEAPAGAAALRIDVDGAALEALAAPCPDAPDERAARTPLGPGCVAAAAAAELERAAVAPEAWVAASPLVVPPEDVARIAIGALVLERKGGGWSYGDGTPADTEAVRAWLDELRSYRGRVVALPAAAAVATIQIAAGTATERLALGADGVVRRDDEPIALALHPSVRAAFHVEPVAFADRRVLAFEPSALAEVDIAAPGQPVERAVRGATGEDWHLGAPAPLDADLERIDALRQSAATLRADRVTAARARPEHGLAPPRRTLTFVTDPAPGQARPAPQVLELGAAAGDGGCYARARDAERVYVLGAAACAALDGHLASRRVFSLASDDVVAVSVGGRRSERHGGTWYGAGGDALGPGEGAALTRLVRQLAEAPAVAGYSPVAGTPIVVETAGGAVALHAGRGVYGLDGRPVRYALAPEICARWPWCRL
jgi:hypothetical protein